jgi:hypothetical protein
MAKEQVVLQGSEVIQQPKLIKEYIEQPLAGYSVGGVYRALKPEDITVL